jgi:hypothetical protein
MTKKKKKELALVHYESVAEMVAETVKPYASKRNSEIATKFNLRDDYRWHGIEGGLSAVKRAIVEGFPEGERTVSEFRDKLHDKLPRALGHSRAKVRRDMGDELDYHAMLKGNNDRAWTTSTRQIRRGSGVLRVVVDIGANAHTSASALRWRGVAGAALCETMRKAGYSLEIVAGYGIEDADAGDTMNLGVSVVIKPRNAPIDNGLLAATVCLPGFFRTAGFSAIVRAADNAGKSCDSGLGHYLDISGILPVPDKVTQIFVPGNVASEEDALNWVKDTVTLLQGARA